MVDKKGIVVEDKHTEKPVEIKTGQEAYFALLAHDMLNISHKFHRKLEEVHTIFYEVSCDRDKLISILSAEMKK